MSFLSHIILSEGREVELKKTEVFMNWPRPFTPTDIRSFLGLIGYYSRFMDHFAFIYSPSTTLTQKSVKFDLLEACERCSRISKGRVTSAPVLTYLEGPTGSVAYYTA